VVTFLPCLLYTTKTLIFAMICIVYRGYYPKGGGIVHVKVNPVKQLKAVQIVERGSLVRLTGFAFVAGVLPYKVHCRIHKPLNFYQHVLLC
jgi:RNA 3'-terminal phosphate cyclase